MAGKPAHCAGRHALRIMAKTRSISPAVFVPAGIGLDRSRKRIYSEPRGNPHQNGEIVERDGGEDPRDYGEVLGELCRGEAEAVERGQNRGTERSVGAEKREEFAHDGLVETPRFPRTSCWSSAVRSGSSRISSRCSDGEQIYSENRGAAHGERFEEAGDQRRSFGQKVRPAKLVQQRVQQRARRRRCQRRCQRRRCQRRRCQRRRRRRIGRDFFVRVLCQLGQQERHQQRLQRLHAHQQAAHAVLAHCRQSAL